MADTVKVSALRENITECPICTEEFDDKSKIPRRMPCCGQPICEECLVRYVRRRTVFPCPLCKLNNNIPGGVRSLCKDMTVLRLLEVVKTQKTKPQSTVGGRGPGASSEEASKLKEKQDKLIKKMTKLFSLEENINMSERIATEQINQRFEDMVEELQQRRVILLSEVEAKVLQERRSVTRALESHKSLLAKLKSASESGQSAPFLLEEIPDDVDADRIGITFAEANMQQLLTAIRSAGQVRLITFIPTQRPKGVPEDIFYNRVAIKLDDFTEVAVGDMVISTGRKDIISPYLELDHNIASQDVQVTSTMMINIVPDPAPQDTGCRFQSQRRALILRPLPLSSDHAIVFSTRMMFTVKKLAPRDAALWRFLITNAPIDVDCPQTIGFNLCLLTCKFHKNSLCLYVVNDNLTLADIPLTKYQVGASCDLHVCIMLDKGTNTIHVVDVDAVKLVTAPSEVRLDRPLWVVKYVGNPSFTQMRSELISGRDLTLTTEMKQLLSSLLRRAILH